MMDNQHFREEPHQNDSSLTNHRVMFKKQKSYSTAYGEYVNENHKDHHQQRNGLSGKAFALKRVESKHVSTAETDKRGGHHDKGHHSAHDGHLSNPYHKKSDSLDKNGILNKKANSSLKANNQKFYLNTNLKMFHFKSNSRHIDSGSKRSPSFSNSNLPTDLPTNKLASTSNSSRPIMTTQKVLVGSKEKSTQIKQAQQNIFEDFKSYTMFKSQINHHARFVTNIKYPYFFDEMTDTTNEQEDLSKIASLDDTLFEKATNGKKYSSWKDDIKKKIEAQKAKTRVADQ